MTTKIIPLVGQWSAETFHVYLSAQSKGLVVPTEFSFTDMTAEQVSNLYETLKTPTVPCAHLPKNKTILVMPLTTPPSSSPSSQQSLETPLTLSQPLLVEKTDTQIPVQKDQETKSINVSLKDLIRPYMTQNAHVRISYFDGQEPILEGTFENGCLKNGMVYDIKKITWSFGNFDENFELMGEGEIYVNIDKTELMARGTFSHGVVQSGYLKTRVSSKLEEHIFGTFVMPNFNVEIFQDFEKTKRVGHFVYVDGKLTGWRTCLNEYGPDKTCIVLKGRNGPCEVYTDEFQKTLFFRGDCVNGHISSGILRLENGTYAVGKFSKRELTGIGSIFRDPEQTKLLKYGMFENGKLKAGMTVDEIGLFDNDGRIVNGCLTFDGKHYVGSIFGRRLNGPGRIYHDEEHTKMPQEGIFERDRCVMTTSEFQKHNVDVSHLFTREQLTEGRWAKKNWKSTCDLFLNNPSFWDHPWI